MKKHTIIHKIIIATLFFVVFSNNNILLAESSIKDTLQDSFSKTCDTIIYKTISFFAKKNNYKNKPNGIDNLGKYIKNIRHDLNNPNPIYNYKTLLKLYDTISAKKNSLKKEVRDTNDYFKINSFISYIIKNTKKKNYKVLFSNTNKDTFKSFMKHLKNEYNNKSSTKTLKKRTETQTKKVSNSDNNSLNTQLSYTKNIENHANTSKYDNTIAYVSLVLGIIAVLLWIIFFISNYRKSTKHRPHDGTIDYLNKITFPHYDKAIGEINSRITTVVSKLEKIQKSLGLYNTRMETLRQAMEKSVETRESYADKLQETILPVPPSPAIKYYLPFPGKQGFFWDDKKSEIPAPSSIYILELENKDSAKGTFTLDLKNEKNIRTALTNPTTFLKPVCESIDNNFYGKNIEIINKGELQLRDGRWNIIGGKKLMVKIS